MPQTPSPTDAAATPVPDIARLVTDMVAGRRRAVAQALTIAEQSNAQTSALMMAIRPHLTGVGVIGVTGPPGAGKSTLVNALAEVLAEASYDPKKAASVTADRAIAIIAVDPSSPVSGGSILGDRLRMTSATDRREIFVRSLSAGGFLGGLSPSAARMIDVFDAAGYRHVIVETVGTGQNEVDIAEVADVRLVVAAPGMGDDIQAMKSGLLEIADIVAVNKCDRPGAEQTRQQLAGSMSLRAQTDRNANVPVVAVSALNGTGISDLVIQLNTLLEVACAEAVEARRSRRARYVLQQSATRLIAAMLADAGQGSAGGEIAERLLDGAIDTPTALSELMAGPDVPG